MIVDINPFKEKTNKYYDLFVNAKFKDLPIICNIFKGNFFSDSFYYFPISENNEIPRLRNFFANLSNLSIKF